MDWVAFKVSPKRGIGSEGGQPKGLVLKMNQTEIVFTQINLHHSKGDLTVLIRHLSGIHIAGIRICVCSLDSCIREIVVCIQRLSSMRKAL